MRLGRLGRLGRQGRLGRLGRLGSPAGLVLAGLCLLLPFLTVSCESQDHSERWQVTYTGTDLVTGGKPEIRVSDDPAHQPPRRLDDADAKLLGGPPAPLPAQPVAWLAVALMAAALAGTALPSRIWRRTLTAGLALAAATVLWGASVLARQDAADALARVLSQLVAGPPPPARIRQWDRYAEVRDLVTHGYGFWIAIAALVAVGAVNTAGLLRPDPPD